MDPAAQLTFLQNIQQLLDEGQFVATYKFALLTAIAELSLERPTAPDGTLPLPLRDIAARIIEIYWPQVAPYRGSHVLAQNTGQQAAIVSTVGELRVSHNTLAEAKRARIWDGTVTAVAKNVREMPLFRLQMLGGEARTFLYDHEIQDGAIKLKPGVAECFKSLQWVVTALVQNAWIRHLNRIPANRPATGPDQDLATFLFGSERSVLTMLREPLRALQSGQCFYCAGPIVIGEIDHFIPWSRYPRDLGHNFVLAHENCNAAKSSLLAGVPHLEAWVQRNDRDEKVLGEIFDKVNLLHDAPTTREVAYWAYENAARSEALVWTANGSPTKLPGDWELRFR